MGTRTSSCARRSTVDATPEQVWAAIATGPGIDSWFMGRNEVEPGGRRRAPTFGGYTREATITAWEPRHRFAYRSAEAEDGRFMAIRVPLEGRDGGSTVAALVPQRPARRRLGGRVRGR